MPAPRNHNEKLETLLAREAAIFFEREGNKTALITVTRVLLSKRGNGATMYVSAFPADKEKAVFDFINRNLSELREYLRERIKSRNIPRFQVVADHGEQVREDINRLLKQ